jgi:hypothetical protein
MMLLPWLRVVAQVACPPLSDLLVQPEIAALLAVNVTDPVGVPLVALTEAVKVTVLEAFDGFALLPMEVAVDIAVA